MRSYETELVKTKKLGDDDIIIAFMGPTGCGKSQIIDTLTGEDGKRAGSSLLPVTRDLSASRVLNHEKYHSRIVLVDTPGYDDTEKSDEEILKLIGDWLKKTYIEGILLSAIVYVHNITEARMSATPHRTLLMFGELTGCKGPLSVVIATTKWDTLADTEIPAATDREQSLQKDFWNVLIHHGAIVQRFHKESDSAWKIVDNIVRTTRKTGLQFQYERVDQKKPLVKTSARIALDLPLPTLVDKQKRTMQEPTPVSLDNSQAPE
ncbi:hypothetical protein M413DRAFT_21883 [Hebeloma cylindrosporum]|uniref:G domain-containing protein n=1 Tax=Hebeloma cylindrosporum TaxID=76867 RepID=A0A0C2YIY5_HEBCY|nr:hypothetical protein M413DRAFT_21883 [Hebeloma cylindrosporum h7]